MDSKDKATERMQKTYRATISVPNNIPLSSLLRDPAGIIRVHILLYGVWERASRQDSFCTPLIMTKLVEVAGHRNWVNVLVEADTRAPIGQAQSVQNLENLPNKCPRSLLVQLHRRELERMSQSCHLGRREGVTKDHLRNFVLRHVTSCLLQCLAYVLPSLCTSVCVDLQRAASGREGGRQPQLESCQSCRGRSAQTHAVPPS